MELFKVWYERSNSVNDEVYENTKYFTSKKDAQSFIDEQQKNIDDWNSPDPSGRFGGRMSIRYFDYEMTKVEEDTPLNEITFGMLVNIIMEVKNA